MGIKMKQTNRHTDQVTAGQIGRQRTERQRDEYWIERHTEQPTRPSAERSTSADSEKVETRQVMQYRHKGEL